MSEPVTAEGAVSAGARATTAGGLLRQARQAQGLHIAALAAAIKVLPRKLELLEADQYDQLPDATFTRALAQAVCRTLKVDAAPVLALLPPPNGHRLEQVSEGLNTPFHDRPGRFVPRDLASISNPWIWVAALLVIGAVVIYALPAGWIPVPQGPASPLPASAAAASSASVPASATTAAVPAEEPGVPASEPGTSAARVADAAAAEMPAGASSPAAAAVALLQVHATAASWVEVIDARGQSLLARLVQPGESIGLEGVMPLKLKIGNAAATQLVFRGQPVELAPFTRDNVARFELK
jgi:cytoskeleton protein RodZ